MRLTRRDALLATFFDLINGANINRATVPRTAAGFAAAAKRAVAAGFRALKAAPWDGFPPPGSPDAAITLAVDTGIASVAAMRDAVGSDVAIMVDCHSFFDVERAVRVAERFEPVNLTWYEEPVAPERVDDTIMPDVKHCGGLLELTRIAAMAAEDGVMVAPHSPSGPVSTAASVQVCAGMKNVNYLEGVTSLNRPNMARRR